MASTDSTVSGYLPGGGSGNRRAMGRLEGILSKLKGPETEHDGPVSFSVCPESTGAFSSTSSLHGHEAGHHMSTNGDQNSQTYTTGPAENFDITNTSEPALSVVTNRRTSRKPAKRKTASSLPTVDLNHEISNDYDDMLGYEYEFNHSFEKRYTVFGSVHNSVENYSVNSSSVQDSVSEIGISSFSPKKIVEIKEEPMSDNEAYDGTSDMNVYTNNGGGFIKGEASGAASESDEAGRIVKESSRGDTDYIPLSRNISKTSTLKEVSSVSLGAGETALPSVHFPCDKCAKVFRTDRDLMRHLETIHANKEPKPVDSKDLCPCFICGKTFASKYALAPHMAVHNAEKAMELRKETFEDEIPEKYNPISRCDRCRKTFKTEEQYQSHCCKRGLPRPYGCGYCGRHYTELSCLTNHLALHISGVAPELECHDCGQRFMYSIELRRHNSIHIKADSIPQTSTSRAFFKSSTFTGSASISASQSPKSKSSMDSDAHGFAPLKLTISLSRLKSSRPVPQNEGVNPSSDNKLMAEPGPKKRIRKKKKKKEKREHECSRCGKLFPDASHLDIHMNVHREKQFMCSICSKKFAFKKSLEIHILTHSNTRPFHCNHCGKNFFRQDSLRKHQNAMHLNIKPWVCETCGRQFTDKFELKRHSVCHMAQKPFTCKVCGKSYTDKKRMTEHMFTHEGSLPFCCHICGKGFARKYRYNQHMDQHSGQTRFHCEECDKGFFRRCDLNAHMSKHKGEKPFKCEDCGMGFLRDTYLRRHRIVHSDEKNHHCPICGKDFARRSTLIRHLMIHNRKSELGGEDFDFARFSERFAQSTQGLDFSLSLGAEESGLTSSIGEEDSGERDIMRDIQAVIGLSSDDVELLQQKNLSGKDLDMLSDKRGTNADDAELFAKKRKGISA